MKAFELHRREHHIVLREWWGYCCCHTSCVAFTKYLRVQGVMCDGGEREKSNFPLSFRLRVTRKRLCMVNRLAGEMHERLAKSCSHFVERSETLMTIHENQGDREEEKLEI